ncbi:MAG: glycosyltransferase [Planctomycetota bacterium]
MRIGIDYHPAVTHAPGVGRYSRELVRALVRLDEAPEVLLADVGRDAPTIGEPALGLADAPRKPKLVTSRQGRKLFGLMRRTADGLLGGVDVFHRMLPDWPPVGKAREVIGVAELPAPGSPADAMLRETLARADAIAFSADTARELRERFGLPDEHVHQVPVGCDHWCRDLAGETPEPKSPPQIVVLGSIHPRRRPEMVLRAVETLKRRRTKCQALYVGGRTDNSDAFLRDKLGGSTAREWVLWNPNASESDMARILATSSVLVHLSEAEATAVTPLEGLAFGLSVVASRLPAFEEALDGQATLLEPEVEEDPDAFADVLDAAMAAATDAEARAARREVAARHTWAANAAATVEVYRRIAARP